MQAGADVMIANRPAVSNAAKVRLPSTVKALLKRAGRLKTMTLGGICRSGTLR